MLQTTMARKAGEMENGTMFSFLELHQVLHFDLRKTTKF